MITWWIFFFLSVITLWLISFWRILCSSSSVQANPSFLKYSNSSANHRRKNNVLLVLAHPDDESMFFSPTILHLASNGHSIRILCISNGNAEGKGNLREKELYKACAKLQVSFPQIKIIDHMDLQDGFDKPWKHQLIATFVEEEINQHCIDVVISFDKYGVSGHPNHRDVHNGICILLRENKKINVEAWELISTNIIRKYIGPIDIWISILSSLSGQNGSICCLTNLFPLRSYQAMAEHYSQWVWFRKIFVVLSRYTYVNTLRRLAC